MQALQATFTIFINAHSFISFVFSVESPGSQTLAPLPNASQTSAVVEPRNFVPRRSPLQARLHWIVTVNSPLSQLTVCTTLCPDTETLNKWFNSISADLSQPGMKRGFGKLPSHMRAAVFYAKDCECAYKFDKSMANHGHPFSQTLFEILSTIMPLCNIFDERYWPNAAHVNWYQNGYVL